jgi:outer membrane protein assembly factor BamB
MSVRPEELRIFQRICDNGLIFAEEESDRIIFDFQWLFDIRSLFLDSAFLRDVASYFLQRYSDTGPLQVGGLETGSIPLVAAVVLMGQLQGRSINGFYVRKNRKVSGRNRLIEGNVTDGPIWVLDDLVNSASSVEAVRLALAECSRSIRGIFCVVDYESAQSRLWRERHAIPISSLFTLRDFGLRLNSDRLAPFVSDCHRSVLGEVLWEFSPTKRSYRYEMPKSRPLLSNGRLFYGSEDGILQCIDALSGAVHWSFPVSETTGKGILSCPACWQNSICFGAYDGNVYSLDAGSGRLIWKFGGADWVGSSPAIASNDELLIIGLEHALPQCRGSIVALDVKTGEPKWEHTVSSYVHCAPIVDQVSGTAVIGSNEGLIFGIEVKTGKVRWTLKVGGAVKAPGTLGKAHDTVIIGSFDGAVYCLSVSSGEIIWKVQTGNNVYSSALVCDGYCIIGSTDKFLYFIEEATGKVAKKINLEAKIYAAPVEIDTWVALGTTAGRLYFIDRTMLEVADSKRFSERITTAVTVDSAHSAVIVPLYDGKLACVSVKEGRALSGAN